MNNEKIAQLRRDLRDVCTPRIKVDSDVWRFYLFIANIAPNPRDLLRRVSDERLQELWIEFLLTKDD